MKIMVARCTMFLVGIAALLHMGMARENSRAWPSATWPRLGFEKVRHCHWRGGGRPAHDHPERGDVPGWVMITLMSAVLVAALLALAGPALETMFKQAMDKVGG